MSDVVCCPKCERRLRLPEHLRGTQVRCPSCGEEFFGRAGEESAAAITAEPGPVPPPAARLADTGGPREQAPPFRTPRSKAAGPARRFFGNPVVIVLLAILIPVGLSVVGVIALVAIVGKQPAPAWRDASVGLDEEDRRQLREAFAPEQAIPLDQVAPELNPFFAQFGAATRAGDGPRHIAFHPQMPFAYVINEIANTVTAFSYDGSRGSLQEIQTITTLRQGYKETSHTAEVLVHPSGRILYGSNRGHDSIAIFTIDPATGKLTAAGHESSGGKTPRNIAIDPTGAWLLAENQGSGTIMVLKIDPKTGGLSSTGHKLEVASPVCIRYVRQKR